jgi:hypothetical protein
MIIGLLDVRWETRHGCSLGLMGLLHGLGLGAFPDSTELSDPEHELALVESLDNEELLGYDTTEIGREGGRGNNDDVPGESVHNIDPFSSHSATFTSTSSSSSTSVSSILPQYLVEDIICTGVCLLMLDRFIDLRASSSSGVSPAREVTVLKRYVEICLCVEGIEVMYRKFLIFMCCGDSENRSCKKYTFIMQKTVSHGFEDIFLDLYFFLYAVAFLCGFLLFLYRYTVSCRRRLRW